MDKNLHPKFAVVGLVLSAAVLIFIAAVSLVQIMPKERGAAAGRPSGIASAPGLAYVISDEDPNKYCNGADMDSAGYAKTISDKKTLAAPMPGAAPADQVRAVLAAAAAADNGRCQQVYEAVKDGLTADNGTVSLPPIDGWAGVSIALCSCKPLFEANALGVPGVTSVVWRGN